MEIDIQNVENTLEKNEFELDSTFLENFYDPVPRGLTKYFFITLILLTVFNVLAFLIIIYIFVYKPRKAKNDIPKDNEASKWFDYAEENLKYNHFEEIISGFRKAIELDPENTHYQLSYYNFLANYEVKNKIPTTGKPIGFNVHKINKAYYPAFKALLENIKESENNSRFEDKHFFALIRWVAFDKKKYTDCLFFGKYSLEIHEFGEENKKEIQQKTELLYLLAGACASTGDNKKAIAFVIQGLNLVQKLQNLKVQIAMGLEFLGECCYKAESYQLAEKLFLQAHRYEKQRWISIYRLFLIYKKFEKEKYMQLYKRKYIQQQKEFGPI